MSAYFIDSQHINTILNGFSHAQYNQYHYLDSHCIPARFNTGDREKLEKIGKKFLVLNATSLWFRYQDKISAFKYEVDSFKFIPNLPPSLVQLYKSIGCLMYQCCERNIPKLSHWYSDLQKVYDEIAHKLASQAKGYEAARW